MEIVKTFKFEAKESRAALAKKAIGSVVMDYWRTITLTSFFLIFPKGAHIVQGMDGTLQHYSEFRTSMLLWLVL